MSAAVTDVFVQGWTERIIYALTHDGQILDLTGLTVALEGQGANGAVLTFTGTVGVLTAAAGTVYLDPAPTDLLAANSPYTVRWAVSDGSGKKAFFPRKLPLVWEIQQP